MNNTIQLGFSTCPNDTFMFDALVHGKVDTEGLNFEVTLGDIAELNQLAATGSLDMVKVSYNAFSQFQDQYHLLDAGSALGHDCGPLLISKEPISVEEIVAQNLPVAIPGKNTTANLLLDYFAPNIQNRQEMIFHEIMPAVLEGKAIAGLIIHENRFTYQDLGLQCIQDLGEYWEQQTGLPIPLGAIVAKHKLGESTLQKLERIMRRSVEFAFSQPEASLDFVQCHAQEMNPEVMQAHINLYVNQYSVSLGTKGRAAVEKLLSLRSASFRSAQ
ncbi:MAG: 1,4-dihydroxy-6-naphthoate synthase [Bacteroidia bacterium]